MATPTNNILTAPTRHELSFGPFLMSSRYSAASGVDLVHPASSQSPVMESKGVFANAHALWKSATKGTVVSSIFILLTTCMGAGTLSLPYAFSQGGIIVFSVIFFFIMVRKGSGHCLPKGIVDLEGNDRECTHRCTYTYTQTQGFPHYPPISFMNTRSFSP